MYVMYHKMSSKTILTLIEQSDSLHVLFDLFFDLNIKFDKQEVIFCALAIYYSQTACYRGSNHN